MIWGNKKGLIPKRDRLNKEISPSVQLRWALTKRRKPTEGIYNII